MTTSTASATSVPAARGPALGLVDTVLAEAGRALQVLSGAVRAARPNPAGPRPLDGGADTALDAGQKRHAAGLMRVNHVGEICAQALYRGQALLCRDAAIREVLYHAADEEVDHLAWCNERLGELDSRASVFNPLWYAGAFSLGVIAARAGTPYNLGFMAETERQVEQHLDGHLETLPPGDTRSRDIVRQMRDDEIQHRLTAENHGAHVLPTPVKLVMRFMSKVMTTTAYRL